MQLQRANYRWKVIFTQELRGDIISPIISQARPHCVQLISKGKM